MNQQLETFFVLIRKRFSLNLIIYFINWENFYYFYKKKILKKGFKALRDEYNSMRGRCKVVRNYRSMKIRYELILFIIDRLYSNLISKIIKI